MLPTWTDYDLFLSYAHSDDVGGIAVHICARVAAAAEAGETLVSSTVKDLVSGAGLMFADRGTHALKGVPGEWRLFAASIYPTL